MVFVGVSTAMGDAGRGSKKRGKYDIITGQSNMHSSHNCIYSIIISGNTAIELHNVARSIQQLVNLTYFQEMN